MPTFNFRDIAIIAGIIGVGIGLFMILKPKPELPPPPFVRPAATNAYVPDPSIDEWSYQNAIRKDYESMVRLETHPYNEQAKQWNVGNLNANYEDYLQKRYTKF